MRAKEAVSAAASERRANLNGHAQLRWRASIAHSGHRVGKILHAGWQTHLRRGRAGAVMPDAELERLWQHLRPLTVGEMPLSVPPPLGGRFGSPLVMALTHVAERLNILPSMGWGLPDSPGHYLDLFSAIAGMSLLLLAWILRLGPR